MHKKSSFFCHFTVLGGKWAKSQLEEILVSGCARPPAPPSGLRFISEMNAPRNNLSSVSGGGKVEDDDDSCNGSHQMRPPPPQPTTRSNAQTCIEGGGSRRRNLASGKYRSRLCLNLTRRKHGTHIGIFPFNFQRMLFM